jgi:RepB DNA-primase from phage plasmid
VRGATEQNVRELVRQRLEGWESRQRDRELRREGWHEYKRVYKSCFSRARDRTYDAVERQLSAMGAEVFEVGALQRGEGDKPQFMLLRTWDHRTLMESIPWLRYQNWNESHIYVRPKGESNLTLVDDLKIGAVEQMRQGGFQPAAIVQTSPGSYQVWIKHTIQLDKELGTAVARTLAERLGGDLKAADWRHFGRLAGFRNTKAKYKEVIAVPEYDEWRGQNFYRDLEGRWLDRDGNAYGEERLREIHANLLPRVRFPFVRLVEASGVIASESERLVETVRARLAHNRADRAQAQAQFRAHAPSHQGALKGIEVFRSNSRYGGDGTRADLAYAVYALSRGVDLGRVRAALRSRDLSHKGNEKRQSDYIERTVRKALATVEQGRGR